MIEKKCAIKVIRGTEKEKCYSYSIDKYTVIRDGFNYINHNGNKRY